MGLVKFIRVLMVIAGFVVPLAGWRISTMNLNKGKKKAKSFG